MSRDDQITRRKEQQLFKKINVMISKGELTDLNERMDWSQPFVTNDLLQIKQNAYQLIVNKEFEKADTVIKKGYEIYPRHVELYILSGFLFEQKGHFVSSYYQYKCSSYFTKKNDELFKLIKKAILRVQKYLQFSLRFQQKSYVLRMKGDPQLLNIEVDTSKLKERRQLLERLVSKIHPESETILDIECGEGFFSKFLNDVGFQVTATNENEHMNVKSIFLEFPQLRRNKTHNTPTFSQMKLTGDSVKTIKPYDTIFLLPYSDHWFEEREMMEAVNIITVLAKKAEKQLFFQLPKKGWSSNRNGIEKLNNILVGISRTLTLLDEEEESDRSTYKVTLSEETENSKLTENRRHAVPYGLEAASSQSVIFDVDISKCRDPHGFSYSSEGWHYFVATLKQYQLNNELNYKYSALKNYFECLQSDNRQVKLFYDNKLNPFPLHNGWVPLPWLNLPRKKMETQIDVTNGENHQDGRKLERLGKAEFNRIIQTFQLLERSDYTPELYPDGYIEGYLLKKGEDYRFIVAKGQHQVAALVSLGMTKIRCRYQLNKMYSRIVDINNSHEWSQVVNKLYPQDVAEKIFYRFFDEDEIKIANICGILPKYSYDSLLPQNTTNKLQTANEAVDALEVMLVDRGNITDAEFKVAQNAVNNLPEGERKDNYQERIDDVLAETSE